jgi:hypothetical protein
MFALDVLLSRTKFKVGDFAMTLRESPMYLSYLPWLVKSTDSGLQSCEASTISEGERVYFPWLVQVAGVDIHGYDARLTNLKLNKSSGLLEVDVKYPFPPNSNPFTNGTVSPENMIELRSDIVDMGSFEKYKDILTRWRRASVPDLRRRASCPNLDSTSRIVRAEILEENIALSR